MTALIEKLVTENGVTEFYVGNQGQFDSMVYSVLKELKSKYPQLRYTVVLAYKEAQRNILSNPFKRFEDMQMLRHTKTLGIIEVEPTVWKHLSDAEKEEIGRICDSKLNEYYSRIIA